MAKRTRSRLLSWPFAHQMQAVSMQEDLEAGSQEDKVFVEEENKISSFFALSNRGMGAWYGYQLLAVHSQMDIYMYRERERDIDSFVK